MKTVVIIRLEIEAADAAAAVDAVDLALDDGGVQDEINFYGVEITDATSTTERAIKAEAYQEAIEIVNTPVLISEVHALERERGADVDYDDGPFIVLENKIRALKSKP